MKPTIFLSAGGMNYSVHVDRLDLPGQPLHLRICSKYAHGRLPDEAQTQLELTLSNAEYRTLLGALMLAPTV